MATERFKELINRYRAGTLTQSEWEEFSAILSSGIYKDWITADMQRTFEKMKTHPLWNEELKQQVWNSIKPSPERSGEADYSNSSRPARTLPFLRTWVRYAAVLLLAFGFVVYYLLIPAEKGEQVPVSAETATQTDIVPGGDRATLQLSDGTVITLHTTTEGTIAREGNSSIVKLADGQIAYNMKGPSGGEEMVNTMTTPRGGQYRLILQDGTKVWLNAASSITYPAIFVGRQRRVSITGEAYFEVARDKDKPFIVDIDSSSSVEVVGTSFNINNYNDESVVKTTLLEGRVKLNVTGLETVVLNPGQQAQVTVAQTSLQQLNSGGIRQERLSVAGRETRQARKLDVISNADLDKVMAWKNGFFDFEGADLKMLMRQLSRWYDIEVVYEGDIPEGKFRGKMDRGLTLSQTLKILSESEVGYRLEGRRLIITQ